MAKQLAVNYMSLAFLILVIPYAWFLHQSSKWQSRSLSSYLLLLFLGWVATTIPAGYLLSVAHKMGQPLFWGIFLNITAAIYYGVVRLFAPKTHFTVRGAAAGAGQHLRQLWQTASTTERLLWALLSTGTAVTSALIAYTFVLAYPNEWDSMTGHLVKCAYYLQHGHMGRMQGTTWTIDFYPNALPTLQLFGYQLLGEKGFKLIHFLSYFVFVISLYRVALLIFKDSRKALYVSFLGSLLPTALIQATTTETDLVFSAYLGLLVWLLLEFAARPTRWGLFQLALVVGIWISHKVTFILVSPAVFLLVLWVIWQTRSFFTLRSVGLLGGLLITSLLIYVLPNGYLANWQEEGTGKIGSLSAPKLVMSWHGIENYTTAEKLSNFKLNGIRYTSDFLHLDGLRSAPWGKPLNAAFRRPIDPLFKALRADQDRFWAVQPFRFEQDKVVFYKERPYWGVIGFGLVLPAVLWLLWLVFSRRKAAFVSILALFTACGIIHFLSLCFSAPYDPIKGRYFMNMAIWFLPVAGLLFMPKVKGYLAVVAAVMSLAGASTLLYRHMIPLTGPKTIATMSRSEQILRTRPGLMPAYLQFEELVPENAIVALGTQQEREDYEYPLFGSKFSRTLIPLHPFRSAVKPIPPQAAYLFFAEGVFKPLPTDLKMNELTDTTWHDPVGVSKFYLRKLK